MDAWMNRLYGWRFNPVYHSGALTVVLLSVVTLTGLYLIFFYRIGSPYDSVVRLTEQPWLGRWIRSLHRYASDAAAVAALLHLFRVFAQGRSWGPRALAWVSGLVLLFITFVCGWTGYVMVWDVQGIELAKEGARWLDALPLFSEPIGRAFVGDREIPRAFFFLNLFLHVALPVGMAILLWVHVARAARPALLPPRALAWGVVVLLTVLSVGWPAAIGPAADLFRLPERAPFDVFYSFWLPITQAVPAGWVWLAGLALCGVLALTPWWIGPRRAARPPASVVNQRMCDACEQCYQDCPYEAISMVPLAGSRKGIVAQVDPALCVSCGICSGSCAPMGVGPPGRTGRDQLAEVRTFIAEHAMGPRDVAIVACSRGAGNVVTLERLDGSPVFAVDCVGSLHTSVVEFLVRSGVGGILIASCPPRDCWNREGPRWLEERLHHGREAELQERVDRRRVRVEYAGLGERAQLLGALAAYRNEVAALEVAQGETDIDLGIECEETGTPSAAT
jgi:ferredoxin